MKISKYLFELGFVPPISRDQAEDRFYESLDPDQLDWIATSHNEMSETAVYEIPKNMEQALALLSHDFHRYVASMEWIKAIIEAENPKTVFDLGCGIGIFIDYISKHDPKIEIKGIERGNRFYEISKDFVPGKVTHGDYLNYEKDQSVADLLICEFGVDFVHFPPSTRPHSSVTLGPASYCPGCSDDFESQLQPYVNAWTRWAHAESALAFTGRLTNFGEIRAFISAMAKVGWYLDISKSRYLRVDCPWAKQLVPGLYFTTDPTKSADELEVAEMFA